MRAKPMPFQKEGVRAIERHNGNFLLGDDQGLGKTLQALWTVKRNPDWGPFLVVCPASVKYNWKYEASRHVGIHAMVCEGTTPPVYNRWSNEIHPDFIIINYEVLRYWIPYLEKVGIKSIILDEVQWISNRNSKRAEATRSMSRGVERVLAMSGTPLQNNPAELFSVLNILWPDEYNSFWSYAQKYCSPRWTRFGWDYTGASNTDLLHQDLKQRGFLRRLKEDELNLPPKKMKMVPVDLTDYREYIHAKNDFINWLKHHDAAKVRKAMKAESVQRVGYLMRLIAKLKLRACVEKIDKFLKNTDEKMVVMGVHQKALRVLEKRLPYKSVTIDGSVTGQMRYDLVDQFQHDPETRLFIGNIKAAGTGITLTSARTLSFVEYWWNPMLHAQASDRVHRIGQTRLVNILHFTARGTMEVDVCKILQSRQQVVRSVLDGDDTDNDFNIYEELLNVLQEKLL